MTLRFVFFETVPRFISGEIHGHNVGISFLLYFMSIVFYVNCQIFVHSGTVCRKAEEHLWAGVVGGFPANCTGMGKLLFKCGYFFLY